jgi:Transglycosylase SLT domain
MMADYSSIIQAAAQKWNIDPNLLRGIIATESSGNPNAQSGVGATGLMQIMPANYKALGITDPTDPTQNIMGGAQLLSGLLDRYGDPVTALRHYQGGDDQSKWGPINAAYPGKVFAAGGIQMPAQQSATLPGIPVAQSADAQSDDQIFAAFSHGAAQPQQQSGPQSDDAIFAAMTKSAAPPAPAAHANVGAVPGAPATQAAPAEQPGLISSFLAGMGRGVQQTALGAQQLLGHGLEALGTPAQGMTAAGQAIARGIGNAGQWLVNNANQGLQSGAQQVAPYQAAHPVAAGAGNLTGSIAAAAPLGAVAGPGASLIGRIGSGALTGGLGAALTTPVDPNSPDYWSAKGNQALLGAATGGVAAPVIGALGRVISPNVSPDVQALLDRGVTPTPGQILGGGWARTEDKLTSLPFLGDMIKSAQGRAVNQFNVAAYNEALAPIGQTFSGKAGQEGIEQVGKQIGDVYDSVLPQMQLKVDPQFQADVTNLGQMANGLPDSQQRTFMNVLKTQIFDKLGPQGNMDGQTLKGVQSELSNTASGYLKDPSFDNRQLGAAVAALRDAVDGNLARMNSPDLAQQLSNANQAWANFARLRAAGASIGAANNEGVFTAAQLQNAVKAGDKSVGKGAFATGNALMQDLSGAGQRVLGSKYPDSGTAGRGLMSLLAPGGIAAGLATAPTSTLATLGGIGLGSLPYTSLGQRTAAALLTARPQLAQPLGNLVGHLGPAVIPGGSAALLSNGASSP